MVLAGFGRKSTKRRGPMFRTSWVFSALYLAVSGVSFAEEKKANSHTRIDVHPDCVVVDTNLLTNCGFESGSFDGWVRSGNPTNTMIVGGKNAHSGSFAASFGPPTLGFIAQTVPTTPGANYQLSFWLKATGQPNRMQIFWDTYLVADLNDVGDIVYTQFTYQLPTVQTMTEIKLGFSDVLGAFLLDDVVLELN